MTPRASIILKMAAEKLRIDEEKKDNKENNGIFANNCMDYCSGKFLYYLKFRVCKLNLFIVH